MGGQRPEKGEKENGKQTHGEEVADWVERGGMECVARCEFDECPKCGNEGRGAFCELLLDDLKSTADLERE